MCIAGSRLLPVNNPEQVDSCQWRVQDFRTILEADLQKAAYSQNLTYKGHQGNRSVHWQDVLNSGVAIWHFMTPSTHDILIGWCDGVTPQRQQKLL